MTLLILSFIAGILTIAAPCILPLLPVIVGGSIARGKEKNKERDWLRPLVITGSLGVSVIIFTLLLKATTALLGVPQMIWQVIAGVIVTLLGIHFLKPDLWEKIPAVNKLNIGSNKLLGKSFGKKGFVGDALIGLSLGPVFNSCSPTYALVVATVLPVSFAKGLLYLVAYAVGLAGTLLIVAYAGQAAASKLGWLSNPSGLFKKVIGVLFVIVGLSIVFCLYKKLHIYFL